MDADTAPSSGGPEVIAGARERMWKSTRARERLLGLVLIRLVAVLLLATAVGVLVAPRDPNIDYPQEWVLLGLCGAAGVWGVCRVARRRITRATFRKWVPWAVAGCASLGGASASVFLAYAVRYRYGWDARVVSGFSEALTDDGVLTPYAVDYLSRYPNNVPLLATMNTAHDVGVQLGWDMYTTYLWINGLCLAMVLMLTFAVVDRLRGTSRAFAAQLVVFLLVGLSPWMAVPYTDLLAMPLVMVGLTLVLVSLRAQSTGAAVAFGGGAAVVLAAAYTVKTTPVTTALAVGCLLAVIVLGSGSIRASARLSAFGLVVAVLFFGAAGVSRDFAFNRAGISEHQLDAGRTPPVAWWLANGLTTIPQSDGREYYGSYSGELVKASAHLRGDELQNWSDHELRRRLQAMSPGSLIAFEWRKQRFNWGDGMFFAWGEGYDSQPGALSDRSHAAVVVQSWNHISGEHYLIRAALTNGVWTAILLWCGLGLLTCVYRRETLLLALAVLGIAVFALVFQGRSRYLLAFVPVVVTLAATLEATALLRRPACLRIPRGTSRTHAASSS